MNKVVYLFYAIWVIACIVLKILGLVDWWVATSCLWMPAGVMVVVATAIFAIADIGTALKAREERKIPNTCENCVFQHAADSINMFRKEGEEKTLCIGRQLKMPIVDGKCEHFSKAQK